MVLNLQFQEQFCHALVYSCPTEEEFGKMDANKDGTLTFDEYLQSI